MTTAPRPLRRKAIRAVAVFIVAAAFILGGARVANAHVSVSASTTESGSRTTLTFRVPTESDTADTVGLTVQFPTDTPFSSVRVKPVPGWTAEVVQETLATPVTDVNGNSISTAVTQIVWTTTDAGIGPDEYGEFEVSASPLPAAGTVYFPTVQTYSDGRQVDWVQQAEGDTEPDHPAPSIEVVAGNGDASADDHGVSSGESAATPVAESVSAAAPDTTAITLGIVAVVIALIAAGGAGVALARTRR